MMYLICDTVKGDSPGRRDYPGDEFFVMGDFNQDFVTPRYYGTQANRLAPTSALNDCGPRPPHWRR